MRTDRDLAACVLW